MAISRLAMATLFLLFGLSPGVLYGSELIVNGGFENGDLSGWAVASQGNGGWYPQSGNHNGDDMVVVPADGTFAAMTYQTGSGAHMLLQDFTIPQGSTSVILAFQLYLRNSAPPYVGYATPDTFDFTGGDGLPNQQVRVDILANAASEFALDTSVLLPIYQSRFGDPLTSGYSPVNFDISSLEPGTYRLRFAEVNNQGSLYMGIDSVSISADISNPIGGDEGGGTEAPEPGTMLLMGLGLTVVGVGRRFVRHKSA